MKETQLLQYGLSLFCYLSLFKSHFSLSIWLNGGYMGPTRGKLKILRKELQIKKILLLSYWPYLINQNQKYLVC